MLRNMQHMGMDAAATSQDAATVVSPWLQRLGEALAAELREQRMSQRVLAGRLDMNDGHVSRIIRGQIEGTTVAFYLLAEQALGLEPGALFRRAGLVDAPTTVREAIESDPALLPAWRDNVIDVYDGAVRRSGESRSAPPKRSDTDSKSRRK